MARKSKGQCWGPTPAHPRRQHVGSGPDSPLRGRAAGRGAAPGLRRPSQQRKASPPGTPFRHPRSAQQQLARAHAVGPVLGPHARTNRTRDARVAEPRLPCPEDGRSGEGQHLTPDAPLNGGRPAPPGTAPHHSRDTQPPQGMQAKGIVLGPHTRMPAPTARGRQTPTARPEGGQPGGGKRQNSDAPHNGERQPPGVALPPPSRRASTARKAWGRCWAPTPTPTTPRTHGSRNPGRSPEDGRQGEGQRLTPDAPRNGGRPAPPGDGPPPPPRHAAPHGACDLRGQCRAPTLAHLRQQHAGSGPWRPAQKTGSQRRGSA